MKFAFATIIACATFFAASDGAFAQSKKKESMTCGQRCSAYCQGKHPNCFDRCSSLRCNR